MCIAGVRVVMETTISFWMRRFASSRAISSRASSCMRCWKRNWSKFGLSMTGWPCAAGPVCWCMLRGYAWGDGIPPPDITTMKPTTLNHTIGMPMITRKSSRRHWRPIVVTIAVSVGHNSMTDAQSLVSHAGLLRPHHGWCLVKLTRSPCARWRHGC